MAPAPPLPSSDLIGGPPPAARSKSDLCGVGGPSSHIATPAKPWGAIPPLLLRLRIRISEGLLYSRQSSRVPFADLQGGVKILPFYACKAILRASEGGYHLNTTAPSNLNNHRPDASPLSRPVPLPPLLLRRYLETTKSHTSFRGGADHPT